MLSLHIFLVYNANFLALCKAIATDVKSFFYATLSLVEAEGEGASIAPSLWHRCPPFLRLPVTNSQV